MKKYQGFRFSILGDSISTLEGFNPQGYRVFYEKELCEKIKIYRCSDTWWGKVIDYFGGELLVNNSWSGSRVTGMRSDHGLFPAGCSDERTAGLHRNTIRPDVIIVYMGINDWASGAVTDYYKYLNEELTPKAEAFRWAYSSMIQKLKKNYPGAELWCCTINTTYMSSNQHFQFPYEYSGTHIEKYNEIIRNLVQENEINMIDLYRYHLPYDSIDGTHPSVRGMDTLAGLVIRAMEDK